MKVLFVSSGNTFTGISPIVTRQGNSLEREGIKIYFFKIRGKGLKGYLSNIQPLKKSIKKFKPDIIHAHYSLSGVIASLAGASPLIVSLMGSDVKASSLFKCLILFFSRFLWSQTIVKSENMQRSLGLKTIFVIPNGIDQTEFNLIDETIARYKLGWDISKKHILFAANPTRPEKNFKLAQEAVKFINENIVLHTLSNINPNDIPIWLNASDVVILSSMREGSPNVIKEAMSCSKPIVATDVGDIKWLFGNKPGHYLSSFDSDEMAQKIQLALQFSLQKGNTKGRERIMELGLDAKSVAQRLIKVYTETLKKHA